MAELERRLQALAAELEWPATPRPAVPSRRPRRRRLLVVALALLLAVAVALAVPGARSAILRAFHLEGVTIVRVGVLPPAQERPLGATLGTPITPAAAEIVLGRPFALPPTASPPQLRVRGATAISTLLADPGPVLLTEFRNEAGNVILKKIAGDSTGVESVTVRGAAGFWIAGAPHVYVEPAAPARLAGHVLVWTDGKLLYRLEGRTLTKEGALRLAREIMGT